MNIVFFFFFKLDRHLDETFIVVVASRRQRVRSERKRKKKQAFVYSFRKCWAMILWAHSSPKCCAWLSFWAQKLCELVVDPALAAASGGCRETSSRSRAVARGRAFHQQQPRLYTSHSLDHSLPHPCLFCCVCFASNKGIESPTEAFLNRWLLRIGQKSTFFETFL